jgi:hypothetical protein
VDALVEVDGVLAGDHLTLCKCRGARLAMASQGRCRAWTMVPMKVPWVADLASSGVALASTRSCPLYGRRAVAMAKRVGGRLAPDLGSSSASQRRGEAGLLPPMGMTSTEYSSTSGPRSTMGRACLGAGCAAIWIGGGGGGGGRVGGDGSGSR